MTNGLRSQLDPVRFGLALGLVAVLYGWGLGIAFGAAEDKIRERFVADAEASRHLYLQKNAGNEDAATAAIKRMDESPGGISCVRTCTRARSGPSPLEGACFWRCFPSGRSSNPSPASCSA